MGILHTGFAWMPRDLALLLQTCSLPFRVMWPYPPRLLPVDTVLGDGPGKQWSGTMGQSMMDCHSQESPKVLSCVAPIIPPAIYWTSLHANCSAQALGFRDNSPVCQYTYVWVADMVRLTV